MMMCGIGAIVQNERLVGALHGLVLDGFRAAEADREAAEADPRPPTAYLGVT